MVRRCLTIRLFLHFPTFLSLFVASLVADPSGLRGKKKEDLDKALFTCPEILSTILTASKMSCYTQSVEFWLE
ncbi:hypothetical protein F4821DRAFT_234675 [Hypoxylon rubiginosum]|uniref:Uncharacterized protein n=1 Tax=Hypoxylon rubiginosum TaxID=110542 RepID=A0ACC0D6C1_9PEZI|nr:hypothetical protein F4821DRAFT_234675 [Hypoxylon rubiginosum]